MIMASWKIIGVQYRPRTDDIWDWPSWVYQFLVNGGEWNLVDVSFYSGPAYRSRLLEGSTWNSWSNDLDVCLWNLLNWSSPHSTKENEFISGFHSWFGSDRLDMPNRLVVRHSFCDFKLSKQYHGPNIDFKSVHASSSERSDQIYRLKPSSLCD